MAKDTSRYIQFYTPGTAAVKVNIQEEQRWIPLPAPKPEKKITIGVDPVAIIGFMVAVCMLVLMAVGINQLNDSRREVAALEHYVAQLTTENQTLEQDYAAGYNLDEVRQKALDMGMVPAEDGTWIYFDYVPGEVSVRRGKADVTGKLCVIGSKIQEEKLGELFGV